MKSVAAIISRCIPFFITQKNYPKYFQIWQHHGFHITPNHYYQPIPDTRNLADELWTTSSQLAGIEMNEQFQTNLLQHVFPTYREEYNKFPMQEELPLYGFHFNNHYFDGTDALVLYCMVRHLQPRRIIECGCGYSTRISAQAAITNGNTLLTCIEPYPSPVIKNGFPGIHRLIVKTAQEMGVEPFLELEKGDILFIDTSHVVRCGGDVNFLFLEVFPQLKKGVIIHIHDIFLPGEYPKDWVIHQYRFWSEQYLLHAFLLFNNEFEVMFANNYMAIKHQDMMKEVFPNSPWYGGGSFWMRRKCD